MRMIRLTYQYVDALRGRRQRLHPQDTGPSALALGSFDGLHRGHQALIRAVREAKQRHGLRSCGLFTFRRHPRQMLGGRDRPFLLTTWREKLAVLDDAGLDVVVAADFCPALARLDYRDFVREFLVGLPRHAAPGGGPRRAPRRRPRGQRADARGPRRGTRLHPGGGRAGAGGGPHGEQFGHPRRPRGRRDDRRRAAARTTVRAVGRGHARATAAAATSATPRPTSSPWTPTSCCPRPASTPCACRCRATWWAPAATAAWRR